MFKDKDNDNDKDPQTDTGKPSEQDSVKDGTESTENETPDGKSDADGLEVKDNPAGDNAAEDKPAEDSLPRTSPPRIIHRRISLPRTKPARKNLKKKKKAGCRLLKSAVSNSEAWRRLSPRFSLR